jgi:6-pyruvoyltetrahydropterin/6-carboxytetrahydropterin synthase
MAYRIFKKFTFSCAHSVYTQRLDPKYASGKKEKCRNLPGHGHNYEVCVCLESKELNDSQMVTDFAHLTWFKDFLDTFFDHKLLISREDPAFAIFLEKLSILESDRLKIPSFVECKVFILKDCEILETSQKQVSIFEGELISFECSEGKGVEGDFYSRLFNGITVISFSPTGENLARLFFEIINKKMEKFNVTCKKVEVWETPTSCACFEG